MDYLLIILILWTLYTVYKSLISGGYYYIVFLVVFYMLLGFFITGPKLRILMSVGLANLLSTGIIITNMISTLSKITAISNVKPA
jgi:hypothetical protein